MKLRYLFSVKVLTAQVSDHVKLLIIVCGLTEWFGGARSPVLLPFGTYRSKQKGGVSAITPPLFCPEFGLSSKSHHRTIHP